MSSYDSSLVATEEREVDFAPVLNAVLDPLLQMCELGAKDLTRFSRSIYMINCLHYVVVSTVDIVIWNTAYEQTVLTGEGLFIYDGRPQ
jgi:hypothetical protein